MKAALLKEPGRLEIKDVPEPGCPQDGVLVQIKACGLCSADAKMVHKGHPALVYPRIPGHEISGVIVESTHPGLEPGLRVQIPPGLRCGRCHYCLRGDDHQCLGREITGFTRDGGFAEMIAVPLGGKVRGSVHPLPDHLEWATSTLAEPLACCINAQKKLDLNRSDHILVIGGGPLGLLHVIAAQDQDPALIMLSDPGAHRRKAASGLGVEVTLDPNDPNFSAEIRSRTKNRGVDVVILACPEVGPDEILLSLMARGGRISLFSGPHPSWATASISMAFLHYMELEISGSYGCRSRDNLEALELLASGRYPFERLIEKRTDFNQLAQDLDAIQRRDALKTILEVDHA
jgi:L-iditol 2-dehydrogenase